jgi:hypothetical protein
MIVTVRCRENPHRKPLWEALLFQKSALKTWRMVFIKPTACYFWRGKIHDRK